MRRIELLLACGPLLAAGPCESLSSLVLRNGSVSHVETVPAGAFKLPQSATTPQLFATLPEFCRVSISLKPSPDSDIRVEVWLPASGWNGKYMGVGNGGWSGAISYPALARAIGRGYAAASTDTGHQGGSAEFALGHPEKLIDFGWRAVHLMTLSAKAAMASYYGNAPKYSYWNGCSSGGKQGLMEAQRFPEDYNGIIAGAPANYWTHLMVSGVWIGQATLKDASSYIPKEKYGILHAAAIEACDSGDGVKDGVIENPVQCKFDPGVLLCKDPGATAACLTAPQVEAARKIYSGPINPRTGAKIFPGLEPGSELQWGAMAGGPAPFPITADHFRYVLFKDPRWNFKTLDFDRDVALAEKADHGLLTAIDPNLRRFSSRGGKLFLYHGWNDQLIAPRNAINYYQSVVKTMGAHVTDSVRLFMVPGMNHCAGGDGPSSFDTVKIIEDWVENGRAPDRMIAAHGPPAAPDRTRPLCPYPQAARYSGSGSTDDAANFVCAAPVR